MYTTTYSVFKIWVNLFTKNEWECGFWDVCADVFLSFKNVNFEFQCKLILSRKCQMRDSHESLCDVFDALAQAASFGN